ncbi:hypothetical protein Mapa_011303 [Marchantia paleacea]|nr:hypothetical protein Mapa_011303 [Marchantia paleacea]
MTDILRRGGGGAGVGGGAMAVTESLQTDNNNGRSNIINNSNNNNGEYWNDVNNQLSPVRKHLINTYLQVQDDEALPLLGEYFGVALSFMALGALVRASNSSKKRRKSISDEERLDLRACSRFQRMALESMLREAMERLRGLAQTAYQTEERVRDLVDADLEMDKEKIVLLRRVADAEKAVLELKGLRKAEGRANERVMSIVAAKEQDWLKEKRSLQKEIDRLKENLNTVCREVKFQSRRCRSPTCEHCKGIERVVRNVRGRVSLRELNYRETSPHASSKREAAKVEQIAEVEEVEEERFLIKAMEQKKKRSAQPGHLQVQTKVEKHVEWTGSSSLNPSGGSAGGAGQSMNKELIAKQQQDVESELANILKRVGMLKQRSHSGGATSSEQLNASRESKNVAASSAPTASLESRSITPEEAEDVQIFGEKVVSELLKEEAVEVERAPSSFVSDDSGQNFELADDLTTGLLTLEQEALLSVEEDPDLLELEKAFEFQEDIGSAGSTDNVTDAPGGGNRHDEKSLADACAVETTEEARILFDEDCEIAEFESHLSSDVGVAASLEDFCHEVDITKDLINEEAEAVAISPPNFGFEEASMSTNAEVPEVLESDLVTALCFIEENTEALGDEDQVLIVTADDAVSESYERTSLIDGDGEVLGEAVVEQQEILGEFGIFEETESSTDAVSRVEPIAAGELSEPVDSLDVTTMETPLQSVQGSPADPCRVEGVSGSSQENLDGDTLEPVVAQDDCSEAACEVSLSPVDEDKPLAEDVKVVDAGDSPEPEQVLEMVEVDSGTALAERQDGPLEDFENLEPSGTETDLPEHDQDGVTTEEKGDLDAEIPVFERADCDYLAGELPEPDEKRVCDSGEADVDVAGNADSADDVCSIKGREECENKKVDDVVPLGDSDLSSIFESVPDPLKLNSESEKMNLVMDTSSLQRQKSGDVSVDVDSSLGGE